MTLSSAALLGAALLTAVPSQQTLRVDVQLVNVVPTVQDAAGRFVTDLKEGDFKIYEDGIEQTIAVFETEDVGSAIGVLLDTSGSVPDILPLMKSGVLDFADHTKSFAELFVMTFGTRVRTIHDVGEPLPQLQTSLKALSAQGTSVRFDALVEG